MSDLQVKLDWFAFTFPITHLGDNDESWTLHHIIQMFHQHSAGRLREVCGDDLWTFLPGRGFYTHSIQHPRNLISINWSAGNPHAQCEISGSACDLVLGSITTAELARAANGRATRIDIATDIVTEESPKAFVGMGYSIRILSTSFIDTPTGQTAYIGSRKGERMARVYRYNPPHPRSKLLRIEIELKGDAAKMACEEMKSTELRKLAIMVNRTFEWKHPIWNEEKVIVSKIPARPYDREGADTLRWLDGVVASALLKADRDGLINLPEWLQKHFPLLFGK